MLLSTSVPSLNHHLKKGSRLMEITIQINFLLCISAGLKLSSVSESARFLEKGISNVFATSTFLAFSKSFGNNEADRKNNCGGSKQTSGLTLRHTGLR